MARGGCGQGPIAGLLSTIAAVAAGLWSFLSSEGRAWNESYLLRAFLMFNRTFEVVVFTQWIATLKIHWLHQHMPLCARGGGGQVWLRRAL